MIFKIFMLKHEYYFIHKHDILLQLVQFVDIEKTFIKNINQ